MAVREHYQVKKDVVLIVAALAVGLLLGFLFARDKYKSQLMATNDLVIGRDAEMKQMDSKLNKLLMWNGAVVIVKDGSLEAMTDASMLLRDGTKIMRNGSYLTKTGEEGKLQNGYSFDMDGKMMK